MDKRMMVVVVIQEVKSMAPFKSFPTGRRAETPIKVQSSELSQSFNVPGLAQQRLCC
jgi:hypothetical protein